MRNLFLFLSILILTSCSFSLWPSEGSNISSGTTVGEEVEDNPQSDDERSNGSGQASKSAGIGLDPKTRAYFDKGYQHFSKKKYLDATVEFQKFLESSTPDDEDYEWGQFFFGVGLHEIGFSHAAVDILAHLVMRKPNPQIVTYCLELFEEIMRDQPFDHGLLINRVLCDQEYGFIEGELVDFVNYYQGIYAWQHGFWKWGDEHFAKITPNSHYHNRYLYQRALLMVYRDRIEDAIAILRPILADEDESDQLLDDVRQTLARLLYELEQYAEADRLYWQIQESILKQSRNLMERAWAHYRMGNAERAMGLLYAFEAPGFKNAFTPEYYILKSFIYKDVCHYQRAMDMVAEFKSRYGPTLEKIYQRKGARENKSLLMVVLNKENVERLFQFIELLETEQTLLETLTDAPQLKTYLKEIYALKMAQSKNELRKLVAQEYEVLANEMLEYEEEAYLMEYEIGLDMYQRVSQVHYEDAKETPDQETTTKGLSIYPFQGEFWNDELADYRVVLPNKCNNMEEWDIFFK